MSCRFVCDRCEKTKKARTTAMGWYAPEDWYHRVDAKGIHDACSKKCESVISKYYGSDPAVILTPGPCWVKGMKNVD